MPHTDIRLEVVKATNTGYPPPVVTSNPDDKIPWRLAQVKRSQLANPRRKVGHRPKHGGYFYRFLGGNCKFGNSATDANDGDFEFAPNRGKSTVTITVSTAGWEIHSVSLTAPLVQTNSLPDTTVKLNNDTNDKTITSGQIGLVVNTTGPGQTVYLYVDPDWDNR